MKTSRDEFGDRMKAYESIQVSPNFLSMIPVCARVDGRSFSKYTKKMDKPFDKEMSAVMHETAKVLLKDTHARIAYVQSDEISLVWLAEDYASQIFFDGKVAKMTSVLAGLASSAFTYHSLDTWFTKYARYPHFDCRVWQVPNKMEASNVFLWRVQDARRNAISSACQAVFSPSALHGKGREAQLRMLADEDIDFWDYPKSFRDGTFFQRVKVEKNVQWPDGPERVWRTEIVDVPMPYFHDVINRVDVIFDGATPRTEQEETSP